MAWLQPGYLTRFERMPTEFGPVTLKFKLSADSKTLEVAYEPNYREHPGQVILHVPPVKGLSRVEVNGKVVDWNRETATVLLR